MSTARTLAEHSILLLGLVLAAIGILVAATDAAVRYATRHRPLATPSDRAMHVALAVVAAGAVVAFFFLAKAVMANGDVVAFDKAFSAAIVEEPARRWRRVMETMTWIGNATSLAVASGVITIVLVIQRRYSPAAWWIIAQLGAGALALTLKAVVERSRPEFAYANELARGWSFPSGHALRIFVFVGLGAYLVIRYARSRTMAIIASGLAMALGLVVAFSRVYLGAHFLTDVAAGLIAATAWVALCVLGIEIGLRRERQRQLPVETQ